MIAAAVFATALAGLDPQGLEGWLRLQPAPVRAAYCHAWRSDHRTWLSVWEPADRPTIRLIMRRVCHG